MAISRVVRRAAPCLATCRQCRKRRYRRCGGGRIACYRFVLIGPPGAAPRRRTSMDSSGRLLVVDDDPSVRAMLVEYLSGHRYDVRTADGGAAMRAEIERDLPDLVLLDIRMPGEDGLTLARFLRERYDVGIVMVTA